MNRRFATMPAVVCLSVFVYRSQVGHAATTTSTSISAEAISPDEITAGSHGNLWFTNNRYERVGQITTNGTIEAFQ